MIIRNNIITEGCSGKIGNLVFRRWGNKTVVSSAPNTGKRKWSIAQKENRLRFRDAMTWSRKALASPEMRKYYSKRAKGMQTVWNVAVADYMKKPEINAVDLSGYRGRKGDTIRVKAHDNFGVAMVIVTILNALGLEVESGRAGEQLREGCWVYKVVAPVPDWNKGRIIVRAVDLPGNTVKSERTVKAAMPPG